LELEIYFYFTQTSYLSSKQTASHGSWLTVTAPQAVVQNNANVRAAAVAVAAAAVANPVMAAPPKA
jgi:hypothetical protein